MKAPPYLHIEWDTRPTEFDKIGCDGLYIKSLRCDWWGYPILILGWLLKKIRKDRR